MSGGFFQRLRAGLAKSRTGFVARLGRVLSGRARIDAALFDELEEILIEADAGVEAAVELVGALREAVDRRGVREADQLVPILQELITERLGEPAPLRFASEKPTVFLIVGVNGAGKTTTVGKLACQLSSSGKRVLIGAGDTFRAAAVDQLEVWAKRAGADFVCQRDGSDPAAVAFDAVAAGRARGHDVVLIDTAGRLQNKAHLMQELAKVHRVAVKAAGRELDEVLLVLDAVTGQNGLSQAELFQRAVPVSGIVLTKLDGTAKGGVVIEIAHRFGIPVKLVGIGEAPEDLAPFRPSEFAAALFEPTPASPGAR
ncbi:MAG TPA: signal recognition particle-docking protein FtsY [Limnochordia bacterium]